MKAVLLGAVVHAFSSTFLLAQNGYVTLRNSDTTLVGFIKPFSIVGTNRTGLEVWRTKTDKAPAIF